MIIRALLRRKARTLLTMAGVAIGVAATVALGAMADGIIEGYGDVAGGSGADLLAMQAEAIDIAFSTVDEQVAPVLESIPGVEEATGMIFTYASTEGMPYFIVFGYDPGGFAIEHFRIVDGEPLRAASTRRGTQPIIIGRAVADDLGKEVGNSFRLYQNSYRIVGIYETGAPLEDGSAVVSLAEAQAISKRPNQVNAFLLKLRRGADSAAVRQRIQDRLAGLTVTLSSDFAQEQDMLQYVRGFTWGVSFIAVVIGGVTVMNTVLMAVFERTKEIGTLRAVGWGPWQVMAMILLESLALCGLGGLTGSIVGMLVVWVVKQIPMASAITPSGLSPGLFLQGMGVAIALGLVGGAYPAWRASRLLPAEAMRAESGAGVGSKGPEWAGTALRNLFRQPSRTLLTLLGIGIAIASMLALGGLSEGLERQLAELATRGGAHLVGMEAGASIDLSTIEERVVRRIAAMEGVEDAEGFLTGYASGGGLPFFVVFGYRPSGRLVDNFRVTEGASLSGRRQALIGRVAAESLNKEVGDRLRILESSFRIVGIYETGVPFEEGGGVISLADAQALFGQPHKVSFLGIVLEDPSEARSVQAAIEARFPEVSISQETEFTEDVADLEFLRAGTWAVAFLALLVGGAGMTNTMVMSVLERTREIGVLRALGWRARWVVGMILRESVALSILGGVVGSLMGPVLVALVNRMQMAEQFVRFHLTPAQFVQALGIAVVLGALGGIYPAWRASRLRPAVALRYE
jgi:ABC-type antimicrobial peptide transport system permease subunit